MGPRTPPPPPLEEGPREAEAAGEGWSERRTSDIRGAKTKGVSVVFMPKKSWKIGLAGSFRCGSVEFLQT